MLDGVGDVLMVAICVCVAFCETRNVLNNIRVSFMDELVVFDVWIIVDACFIVGVFEDNVRDVVGCSIVFIPCSLFWLLIKFFL